MLGPRRVLSKKLGQCAGVLKRGFSGKQETTEVI